MRFSGKAGAGGLCADYHGQGEINRYETGLERKNEKMNISRKDFFKKSLLSLGEVVCSVSDVLKPSAEPTLALPDIADFVAVPRDDQLAVAHNEYCLAKNSGCFACVECCDSRAIRLMPGVGIRINSELCAGCGTCEYVCPVDPKAVRMMTRTVSQSPPADSAEIVSDKEDATC